MEGTEVTAEGTVMEVTEVTGMDTTGRFTTQSLTKPLYFNDPDTPNLLRKGWAHSPQVNFDMLQVI